MLKGKTISLIIPVFNEANNIAGVLESIPSFVDHVIIVNDGSQDNTGSLADEAIAKYKRKFPEANVSFHHLNHDSNKGKGAAVKTGYRLALSLNTHLIGTIDGDGQMDMLEFESLCIPVVGDIADYVKGERLSHHKATSIIPSTRLFGIRILSFATRVISGYSSIKDAQSGFTVISREFLKRLPIKSLYDSYGYPNDILIRLSMLDARVKEIPITPIYHPNAASKMRIYKVIPKISLLLLRLSAVKLIHHLLPSRDDLSKLDKK